jgi:hypothetical protein
MTFPASFVSTTIVQSRDPAAGPVPVLDSLERTLQDYDADITLRGEDFFEFRVPLGARLVNDLLTFGYRPRRWTPLTFVSAGSFSVKPLRDRVVVSADVQVGQYLLTRVAPLAAISGVLSPLSGPVPSLVFGACAGLGIAAIWYGLARWEFGSWLKRLDLEIGADAGCRLTSA